MRKIFLLNYNKNKALSSVSRIFVGRSNLGERDQSVQYEMNWIERMSKKVRILEMNEWVRNPKQFCSNDDAVCYCNCRRVKEDEDMYCS